MTQLIGTVKVNDLAPVANITAMAMVDEGVPLDLDARASTSFPDAITKYEWDFDYDGTTFDIDDTGNLTNHTYMD
ncbi:MAG: hypothetical protein GWN18_19085, partial [Thermoplasmata archaeon]|nr:hypothetical protein [Thermoplasmata archaeon]NIS14254.1 hypothetical protein [Thermoplasmata archaeon]NIS22080.1 hypothetical protein [Thermoplasmata archaeon]NIT79958.1 hypothetical protein [Thermoplasmata archaeon]NIU51096.1 hypothetical protein [Thermoplasmata archaeon]